MSKPSGWQLSGHAPDAYERYIVPAFMAAKARELVEMARVRSGERVLDVACGTGVVTRAAGQAVGATGKVVGADLNEPMLSMARVIAQRHPGLSVEWHHADAMALPFPAATFHVVLCQYGLEFFPDRSHGLREMARVLVPGGRLALRVWRALDRQPFYVAVLKALDQHLRAGAGAPIATAFTLADANELRRLVSSAGFRDVCLRITLHPTRYSSVEEYTLGYLSATPVAEAVAAMAEAARRALLDDVSTALAGYVDDDGLAAPTESHVVVAHT